jgi:hypothetical protein
MTNHRHKARQQSSKGNARIVDLKRDRDYPKQAYDGYQEDRGALDGPQK